MLETVALELRELGIDARVVESWGGAGGAGVIFRLEAPLGRLKGEELSIGVSFQETAYPEYPPHFIHVAGLQGTPRTRHSKHEFESRKSPRPWRFRPGRGACRRT